MALIEAIRRSGGGVFRRSSLPVRNQRLSLLPTCRWSSCFVRNPSTSAPREAPTPLLFVSAKDWDIDSSRGVDKLATILSMKGFTCVHCDLSPPTVPLSDSNELMQHFVADLVANLRLSWQSPFPPVLFARSAAALIAQKYISSYSVTAMMLMGDIPSTNADVPKNLLPTPLAEFNFEPTFPIALLTTPREMDRLRTTNRLAQADVDLLTAEELGSQEALLKIEGWLDDLGI
ncbi:hypothetical protein MSAN_02188700 [Mycena sanguinolenta]|uniref:Uncharacterized protein n=1 Tax=Mycena sanguinolenta TaxID=230812 RepID=A0A8H7CKW8_9AGAR|nr:hypothetical protein MSAN_02188700 [Mycena sanguinolenta]